MSGLIRRRGARIVAAALAVAAAVALTAYLDQFVTTSQSSMTARAVSRVAVDWQVAVSPGADVAKVRSAVTTQPGTAAVFPVSYARLPGLSARSGDEQHTTADAVVLGIPAGYRDVFAGQIRVLSGDPAGVLIAQQTASNLHAAPGSQVAVHRPGLPPATVTVGAVVDLPQANTLFQDVDAPPSAQPTAPPDNVLILPSALYSQVIVGPMASSHGQALSTQLHVRRDHPLPSSPSAAYVAETAASHHLDAVLHGLGHTGDNLAATLDAARSDASYATVLFFFLGLPAVAVAAGITAVIAATGATRRRRDYALARTRGATTGQLLLLAGGEAALVAVLGCLLGIAAAAVGGGAATGGFRSAALVASLAGIAVTVVSVAVPAWREVRSTEIHAARAVVATPRRKAVYPVAAVVCAAMSALVWQHTRGHSYNLVLAPEGVAAISVDYGAFTAPALLWIAVTSGAYGLTMVLLTRGRPVAGALVRVWTGRPLAATGTSMLTHQRALIARTVTLLVVTLAFAISTATFTRTYQQQATVDARLTNGADVTVTTTAPVETVASVAGVRSAQPLQHRYAYVGADLQDLFGVDPAGIRTVGLQDSWFTGGSANQLLDRLARQPDAILASAETVADYQLRPGDPITLRINGSGTAASTATFHYAGVVTEFPTAPKDSFFVANAAYLNHVGGAPTTTTYLVSAARPAATAQAMRKRLGAQATITDITTTAATIGSSLTAVDLTGLARIETSFAIVLVLATAGLLFALTLAERRRTFTLAALIGARRRHLFGFVAAEAFVIIVAALVLGAASAGIITVMLVQVLHGVFDPPPDHPSVAWAYTALVVAAAIGSLAVAALFGARHARPDPEFARER
ncbi:putative ABC transport system permease protein [Hamadaea flava]|uniref:FtsX-like permease family protein n=2 Tax=Hamadaea flava TaxID=1742688 RepID=A0ABV8LZN6_9ACTN|nr:putative ABC transport system permease protein [Hamadaea flava]